MRRRAAPVACLFWTARCCHRRLPTCNHFFKKRPLSSFFFFVHTPRCHFRIAKEDSFWRSAGRDVAAGPRPGEAASQSLAPLPAHAIAQYYASFFLRANEKKRESRVGPRVGLGGRTNIAHTCLSRQTNPHMRAEKPRGQETRWPFAAIFLLLWEPAIFLPSFFSSHPGLCICARLTREFAWPHREARARQKKRDHAQRERERETTTHLKGSEGGPRQKKGKAP